MLVNKFIAYQPYINNVVSFGNKAKEADAEKTIHVFKKKNGEVVKEFVDKLDEYYNQRNIIVLGSSRSTPQTAKALKELEKLTEELGLRGYNIITGAGDQGVMGAATTGAHRAVTNPDGFSCRMSAPDYAGESLSVLTQGGWGDEDLVRTKPISLALSGDEHERIKIFNGLLSNPNSAVIVAEPGATTLQEMTTLISLNKYRDKGTAPKKIFLLGKETFKYQGLQYQTMYKHGNLPFDPYDPKAEDKLFQIVESEDILKALPDKQEALNTEIRSLTKEFLGLPESTPQKELVKKLEEFIQKCLDSGNGLFGTPEEGKPGLFELYAHIRVNKGEPRKVDGDNLLQNLGCIDDFGYPGAVRSGIGQIIKACKDEPMHWQKRENADGFLKSFAFRLKK